MAAVFTSDGDVSAVVEGFLQRLAELFFGGKLRDPAFQFFVLYARSDFERVGIERLGV